MLLLAHLEQDARRHRRIAGAALLARQDWQVRAFHPVRRESRGILVVVLVLFRLGAQGTVCAGGRFDGLVSQLGGKPAPACGFAMGIERLIALIKESGGEPAAPAPDVYLVHQGEAASRLAFRVAEGLRDQGIAVVLHCGGGSFKSQMKKADGCGATFAVIIGDDEAATGEAQLKPLREEGAAQLKLKVDDLAEAIIGQLIDSDEEE